MDLKYRPIDAAILKHLPEALARRYCAIPVEFQGNVLLVAMGDPGNIQAVEDLQAQAGRVRIQVAPADPAQVNDAIDLYYKATASIAKQVKDYTSSAIHEASQAVAADSLAQAPVVQTLDLLLLQAIRDRASDIHIEPQPGRLRVRSRIDGVLQDALSLPMAIHSALVSRVKILAEMNIAERRAPQDGQFTFKGANKEVDVRVASIETAHGERVELRLLDKGTKVLGLGDLGFLPDALDRHQTMLRMRQGMILIGGPTGAGKTTTLYASLNTLDAQASNIITVEDPIEYRFTDINQIQVNPKISLTFANALRAIMRHDPDVILVGEIRDGETAEIAAQAALTGHLVLSSIHANDAEGVVYRLVNLGVPPFLVASALVGVVAQRMVRRVCSNCAASQVALAEDQAAFEQEMQTRRAEFIYGRGCQFCVNTGYRGRIGVFEVMTVTENLRRLILANPQPGAIKQLAVQEGMVPMMRDGMLKVQQGITTPKEVLRTLYSLE